MRDSPWQSMAVSEVTRNYVNIWRKAVECEMASADTIFNHLTCLSCSFIPLFIFYSHVKINVSLH